MIRPLTAAILAATLATAAPAHAIEGRTGVFGGMFNAVGSFFSRNASSQYGAQSRESGYVSGMRSLDRMYREGKISRQFYTSQMAKYSRAEQNLRNGYSANGQAHDQRQWSD